LYFNRDFFHADTFMQIRCIHKTSVYSQLALIFQVFNWYIYLLTTHISDVHVTHIR